VYVRAKRFRYPLNTNRRRATPSRGEPMKRPSAPPGWVLASMPMLLVLMRTHCFSRRVFVQLSRLKSFSNIARCTIRLRILAIN
jgi:hypothetical protein